MARGKRKKSTSTKKSSVLNVPIDKECKAKLDVAEVFVEGKDIYDVMLNQTNLQFNNNKFYIIQLLKDKDNEQYSVWMRWARVGKVGQSKLESFKNDLEAAKACFTKKFWDKTGNEWASRKKFVKLDGKYDMLEMNYEEKDNLDNNNNNNNDDNNSNNGGEVIKKKLKILECKLQDKIEHLMRIFFDIKAMDFAVSQMNYDANKLPLGRLTDQQIKAGYVALREIENILVGECGGGNLNQKLVAACNTYYTRIPHDFGMRVPTVITEVMGIKRELELLESLTDIHAALDLMQGEEENMDLHPLDRQYNALQCSIVPIESTDTHYKMIEDFLLKTHGSTHNRFGLELVNIYTLKKESEYENFVDYGNKMLLWHGSRVTNYGGILGQGLRIAPPEAPVSGHMFGKGVYFTDISSKSAQYVNATRSKNIGYLLLCEVSLGKIRELVKADSKASKLPDGYHSVKGLGMIATDESSWCTIDEVTVPSGFPKDTGLSQKHKGYLLNYNEYIVYNRNQIKMRYLVEIKFNFK